MLLNTTDLCQAIEEIVDYARHEHSRLLFAPKGQPETDPTGLIRGLPEARSIGSLVSLRIDPRHGLYKVDTTTAALIKLVLAIGASIALNRNRSLLIDKEHQHLVPDVNFPLIREKASLYRVITDARRGQKANEKDGGDHHDLLPESLPIKHGTTGNPEPTKYKNGRLEFIGMCIRQIEQLGAASPISVADVEVLLRTLYLVGDIRREMRLRGAMALAA